MLAVMERLLRNLDKFTDLDVLSIDIPYPFDISCLSWYDDCTRNIITKSTVPPIMINQTLVYESCVVHGDPG